MRTALTFALGGLTLATGIVTALVQCSNYERARELAELQRAWENLEAINVQREARAAAHVVAFEENVLDELGPLGHGDPTGHIEGMQ